MRNARDVIDPVHRKLPKDTSAVGRDYVIYMTLSRTDELPKSGLVHNVLALLPLTLMPLFYFL